MSHDILSEILENREKFKSLLNEEISKIDDKIARTDLNIESLNRTKCNVAELSKKVEHQALIPLGKRIYVPGAIVHPGEYFIDRKAHPDAFTTLETANDTVNHLERRMEKQQEILETYQGNRKQLNERIQTLYGNTGDPEKIESDKGIAVKVGDFYEILEYEED